MEKSIHYSTRLYKTFLIIVLIVAIPCSVAYLKGDIKLLQSILVILFASLTVFCFFVFFQTLEEKPLGVQKSAPSIDGSISGWRLTNSLTLLLITCVFAIATLIVYFGSSKTIVVAAESGKIQKDSSVQISSQTVDTLFKKDSENVRKITDSIK